MRTKQKSIFFTITVLSIAVISYFSCVLETSNHTMNGDEQLALQLNLSRAMIKTYSITQVRLILYYQEDEIWRNTYDIGDETAHIENIDEGGPYNIIAEALDGEGDVVCSGDTPDFYVVGGETTTVSVTWDCPTPTPTTTPAITPTPSSTPGCGLTSDGHEAWIYYQSGQGFYMNCYESQNEPGQIPEVDMTWYDAQTRCVAGGKLLCSKDQWILACQGFSNNLYPYGDNYDPDKCWTEFDINEYAYPFQTGIRRECVSDFGIYDLSGNVMEWSVTPWEDSTEYYYKMGGNWTQSGPENTCYTYKEWQGSNATEWTGYRCCREP